MKNSLLILFTLIFISCGVVFGALHDIDRAELECINNTSDTQLMNRCSEAARKAWEDEINKTLYKLRDKTIYKDLILSQRYWEKFKSKEFQAIDQMVLQNPGTMYQNIASGMKVELVKQRALQLNSYLDLD